MTRFYALCALGLALSTAPALAQSADRYTGPPLAPAADAKSVPLGDARSLVLLYDNGPLQTGTGNGAGGGNTSSIGSSYGSNAFGLAHNAAASVYVADDFTVPAGGWTVSDIEFFSYQTGGNITTSTFTNVFVQIWNGRPGDAGSTVIFGDLTTNRLASSTFSGIYRVESTTLTNNQRPVFRNTATIGTTLPAGTYWVQWGSTGSLASGPWAPQVTTTGSTPPPGNARQFTVPTAGQPGVWQNALDGGVPPTPGTIPVDFPFVVNGSAGTPTTPILDASPGTLAFGSATTGTTTAAQTVTLRNTGTGTLTIASITGSGAPFEVNTTGTSLSLDANATTTFSVTFAPTVAGAATGSVVITTNDPASPRTIALSGTGTAPGGNVDTYPSTDTPITIPDNIPAGTTSTITVTDPGTIADLDVRVGITHTWVGDLTISLTNGTTTAGLAERPGRAPGTTGTGCAANNMRVILDDEGTVGTIQDGCVGLATTVEAYTADGRYTPRQPLSAFDGAAAAGSWVLSINDQASLDAGTLDAWALLMSRAVVSGETGAGAAIARLSVSPNPSTSQAQLRLTTAAAEDVRVALLDALGREVRVLFEGRVGADQEAYIAVRTAGLAPGVYVVRAVGATTRLTERLTVAR